MTEIYYPIETSTGYILTHICEALAESFNILVITSPVKVHSLHRKNRANEIHNSVRIIRCVSSSFDQNSLLGRIINVFARTISFFLEGLKHCRRGEIIFAVTNPPTLPLVAFLVATLRNCQYVLIIHDVYPDVLDVVGYGKSLPGIKLLWRRMNRIIYQKAVRLIVLGRDMSRRIEQEYLSEDYSDGKLICIPNWAETKFVFPSEKSKNPLLHDLNIIGNFVVLYAGNLGLTHDVVCFAKAIKNLSDRSDIHFLTIAVGKKRPWLQRYIAEHNLQNTTLIPLEERPRSEQNVSLNAGDVAIISFIPGMAGISVPSRMYNCMAAGKPIIAVADAESELAQVIVEEDIGWVVAPEDVEGLVKAIEFAAGHPQVCAEMGQRAVAVARSKYTFERAISSYKELLEKLLLAEHQ